MKEKNTNQKTKRIAIVITIIIVAIWVFNDNDDNSIERKESNEEIVESNKNKCIVWVRNYAKNQLEFPSEAKFESFPYEILVSTDSTFAIKDKVVAKNAYGVKSELSYSSKVRYSPKLDSYELLRFVWLDE